MKIGVNYSDSGIGTDLAKIMANALYRDPKDDIDIAKLQIYAQGEAARRRDLAAQTAYTTQKTGLEKRAFDEQTSAADAATGFIADNIGRNRLPLSSEPPIVVEPFDLGLHKTPAQQANEQQVWDTAASTPTTWSPDPARDPAVVHLLPDDLQPPTWPAPGEPPAIVELNGGPLPQTYDQLAPPLNFSAGRIADPSQVVDAPEVSSWFSDPDTMPLPVEDWHLTGNPAPSPAIPSTPAVDNAMPTAADAGAPSGARPFPTGPAVDNGDNTVTTQAPDGSRQVMPKEEIRKLAIVAMRSTDPAGQMQKLAGQLGLTYSDDPRDLEKAMILLGEDATKLPTSLGGEGSGVKQSDIAGMRKEIVALPAYKALSTIMPIYESLAGSLNQTDAASDLNFIYGVATILDPTSVVRDADGQYIVNSASWPDSLKGALAKAKDGKAAIGPQLRQDLLALAKARVDPWMRQFDLNVADYAERAQRNGWDPRDVIPTLGEGEATPPAQAQPAATGAADVDEILKRHGVTR